MCGRIKAEKRTYNIGDKEEEGDQLISAAREWFLDPQGVEQVPFLKGEK